MAATASPRQDPLAEERVWAAARLEARAPISRHATMPTLCPPQDEWHLRRLYPGCTRLGSRRHPLPIRKREASCRRLIGRPQSTSRTTRDLVALTYRPAAKRYGCVDCPQAQVRGHLAKSLADASNQGPAAPDAPCLEGSPRKRIGTWSCGRQKTRLHFRSGTKPNPLSSSNHQKALSCAR